MKIIDEAKRAMRGRDWRGRSRTPRSAEQWVVPREAQSFPTGWARTPAVTALRTGLQRGVLKPLAWSQTRPVVEGLDHLDGFTGPAVFVANHASHLDTPLILGSLPRRVTRRLAIGAAADYFFDARWRAIASAVVFNAFPVDRFGSRRARSLAPELLDRGYNLLLFPESSRSQDGWMSSFRLGAAHLCCARGVPAVPIALRGTFGAMPRGRNWPRPGRPRVVIRYGRPLWPKEGESSREFNERLSSAVKRLWIEEDVGWYRALRTDTSTATAETSGPPAAEWRRIWESTRPLDSRALPTADEP